MSARISLRTTVLLVSVLALVGWLGWYWYTTPAVPLIDLGEQPDPALVRAVAEARAAVQQTPRSAVAWGRLGQLLLAHAFTVAARPCLAQAERLEPTAPAWPYLQGWSYLLDDPPAAVPCLRRAFERSTPTTTEAYAIELRLAQTLFERSELDEAEQHFQHLLSQQPNDPVVHAGLGKIALARGDFTMAIAALRQATDSPFTQQIACLQLAVAYRRVGQPSLAEGLERRARTLPKDAEWPDPLVADMQELVVGHQTRFMRAERVQRQGQLAQAAELYRELLRDYPDDTRALVKLGIVLVELGDAPAAETVLRQALAHDPALIQAQFFLSAALFREAEQLAQGQAAQAKFAQAAAAARQTLKLQPNHGFALVYLGLSLRHLGQLDDAVKALQQAVLCNPDSVEPHLHLGETLLIKGSTAEAIRELAAACTVAPHDARPRKALARAQAKAQPSSTP